MKLICAFGFAYADCWFSHEVARMIKACFQVQFILLCLGTKVDNEIKL